MLFEPKQDAKERDEESMLLSQNKMPGERDEEIMLLSQNKMPRERDEQADGTRGRGAATLHKKGGGGLPRSACLLVVRVPAI